MKTICKFLCTNIDKDTNKVTLETQYDSNLPEDQRFCQATPWGKLETIIDNPVALAQMQVGKSYYLTLEAC